MSLFLFRSVSNEMTTGCGGDSTSTTTTMLKSGLARNQQQWKLCETQGTERESENVRVSVSVVCACVRESERERDIKSSSCNENAQEAKCGCRSRVVGHISFTPVSFHPSFLSLSLLFLSFPSLSLTPMTAMSPFLSIFLFRPSLKSTSEQTTSLHLFSPQNSVSSISSPVSVSVRSEFGSCVSLSLSIVGRGCCVSYAASCLAGDETCSPHIKNNNHSSRQPRLRPNRDIKIVQEKILIAAARETIRKRWSNKLRCAFE